MRVGILTFHEGLNHGAFLQAFATMRVLQGLGHDVEIINYKNKRHHYLEDVRPWQVYRRPVRFINHWKKMRAFKTDQMQMTLSPFTKDPAEVKRFFYDVAVVGSDVVWNYKNFGYDDLYFGGVNADRVISYAPSFGSVNAVDPIPPEIAEGLAKFDAISVRDLNSQKIVKSLLRVDAPLVLDPTLIYDFARDGAPCKWVKKSDPYLLVYAYQVTAETIRVVQEYAKKNGLKIIATGYWNRWCDHSLMGIGPLEWLTLFQNAHTVLTSTFHGAVFSLKNRKTFFYISNDRAKNRVLSLFHTCGISSNLEFAKEASVELIQPEYEGVNARLAAEAEFSRNWLIEHLQK